MKQNLPIAKLRVIVLILILVAEICVGLACAKMPRSESGPEQLAISNGVTPSVNVNTASAEELEKLPGIGKVIAERIVSHRALYGPFRRPEHLMMVRGVSDKKFRAIRPRIKID